MLRCGQEYLVLMNYGLKLAFNIKITTENCVIFCVYPWKDKEVNALFIISNVAMSIEKANEITGHHDKE